MQKRPTIYDVASVAGVSTGTVSRILNGHGAHAPETAARVQAAMREMGFHPRRHSVRDMRQAKMQPVWLLLPSAQGAADESDAARALNAELARGADGFFGGQGDQYRLSVGKLAGPETIPEDVLKRQAAGVMLRAGAYHPAVMEQLRAIPLVWVMEGAPPPRGVDVVSVDNVRLGQAAAEKLLAEGHRKIAFLRPRIEDLESEARLSGFRFLLRTACIELVELFSEPHPITTERIAGFRSRFHADAEGATAVFVPADDVDFELACKALHGDELENGPTLLGVVADADRFRGFGGRVHLLRLNPERIGWAAAEQLAWRVRHPYSEPRTLLVQPN